MTAFVERGGVWALAQGVLMLLVLAAGPLMRATGRPTWGLAAAAVLLAAGAGAGIAGAVVLGKNRTIFPQPTVGSALVRRGIYAWIRHPLYTSLMCLATAWTLFWWSWPTGLLSVALMILLVAKSRREEVWLRQRFADYAGYAREIPAFVPRWPARHKRHSAG